MKDLPGRKQHFTLLPHRRHSKWSVSQVITTNRVARGRVVKYSIVILGGAKWTNIPQTTCLYCLLACSPFPWHPISGVNPPSISFPYNNIYILSDESESIAFVFFPLISFDLGVWGEVKVDNEDQKWDRTKKWHLNCHRFSYQPTAIGKMMMGNYYYILGT